MSMMTPVLSDLPCLAQGPGASDVLLACQRELILALFEPFSSLRRRPSFLILTEFPNINY
jgi:hypothetical protein